MSRFSVPFRSTKWFVLTAVIGMFAWLSAESVAERPQPPTGVSNRAIVAPATLPTQDLDSGLTLAGLVDALVGTGVTVSNVTYTGVGHAAGKFSGGTGILGFESGIVLSSGNIVSVAGPDNLLDSTSTDNGQPGDTDLDGLIPAYASLDATILEFDFECADIQTIQFQYVFTSEEYNEYVNSPFNDVFGFFLNGVNIALVPGAGTTPVAINNVNCDEPYNPPAGGANCNLYRNNDCFDIPPGTYPCTNIETEMDGLTEVFTATGSLNPGINHIKLAIADAGDHVLDSNVFIKAESFTCELPRGACCDTSDYTCLNNVLEANCQGPYDVWSAGLDCDILDPPCAAPPPICGDGVINQGFEECDGLDDAACPGHCQQNCTCPASPMTVPTVSAWGLGVMALILIVGAKIYFGRRRATHA